MSFPPPKTKSGAWPLTLTLMAQATWPVRNSATKTGSGIRPRRIFRRLLHWGCMNWVDWGIIAFLAVAGFWGFRHGALRLLVLGVIMALGLSLGDFFFRAILGLVRGFFSDAAESTLERVALYGAIIGGAVILWLAWGLVSRIPVGISVSRLLGAVFRSVDWLPIAFFAFYRHWPADTPNRRVLGGVVSRGSPDDRRGQARANPYRQL